jgi:hypothetical protein
MTDSVYPFSAWRWAMTRGSSRCRIQAYSSIRDSPWMVVTAGAIGATGGTGSVTTDDWSTGV